MDDGQTAVQERDNVACHRSSVKVRYKHAARPTFPRPKAGRSHLGIVICIPNFLKPYLNPKFFAPLNRACCMGARISSFGRHLHTRREYRPAQDEPRTRVKHGARAVVPERPAARHAPGREPDQLRVVLDLCALDDECICFAMATPTLIVPRFP